MISLLYDGWMGRERLWRVWWLLLVPFNIFFGLAGRLGLLEGTGDSSPLIAVPMGFALILAPLALTVMIWRCAPNVDNPVWCRLARLSVILSWLLSILTIVAPQLFVNSPG
jgi:hypothetical protein